MTAAAKTSLTLQSEHTDGFVRWLRTYDAKIALAPGPDAAHPFHGLNNADPHGFAWLMIITTSVTTITWIVVTLLTPPEPESKLREFYRKVQPATVGWKRIAALEGIPSTQ